ncbi:hypothetical protein GBZ48_09145 [Azospirillum melinis]|uniref:Uncharacterized protein n=1 Tax=Azospirillum melinis TaxID=328839 RepID=A0ABX2KDJ4_9PROT|nr:hypothetical protein [Azospirillum melinis]
MTSGSVGPAVSASACGTVLEVGVRVPAPGSTASLPRGVMKANGRETVDVATATFMTRLSGSVNVEH